MQTLNDMVRSGKVRYLGLSNMYCNSVVATTWPNVMVGTGLSACNRTTTCLREVESDVSQYCQWAGVGMLPYFPLAGGLLAGR